jgi:MFS family permease
MVMLPIALLVGHTADTWGRKPLFLAGFAVLPIRAVLYTASDNSFWLIGVQVLDGVGAGIFGALTPLVIADIMRGIGRYNLVQGAVATARRPLSCPRAATGRIGQPILEVSHHPPGIVGLDASAWAFAKAILRRASWLN